MSNVGEGTLVYSRYRGDFKLIVEVDPGIAVFYRTLIPKSVSIQSPKYTPHITVIRKETPPHLYMGRTPVRNYKIRIQF